MELKEIKSLIEEQGRLQVQFREKVDKEIAEIKATGQVSTETKTAIDAMNARFDEIETKLARRNLGIPAADQKEKKSIELVSMEKFFRYGLKGNAAIERMSDEEKVAFADIRKKSLNQTSDSGGGFFTPEDFQTTVIQKVANIAGVSGMVSQQPTSRDVVRWPKVNYTADNVDNSSLTLTWEDEADTATDTDPTPIGSISIPVKKARGRVLVDRELLEDSAVDVTQLLTNLIADKIAVDTDRKSTIGSGGKTLEGFMINADIPTVNSGSAGAFTMDGIHDLVYTLPEQYAANATFMAKRLSMGAIRKLKDGSGRYLWEPSTQIGTPATLDGYPIKANEHVAAIASAARAMIFADFKRLYMLVTKNGMSIQRLDEKYADTDQVGFIFRIRLGGAVIMPWAGAIQVLT